MWDNPYDDNGSPYGAGTNDLRTLIKLSKRVKAHKFKFILDIHYSDFWTDPGKQIKPKAWQNKSGEELEKEVYEYTAKIIYSLKEHNIEPEMIQIGNEVTNGLLWPDGKLPNYSGMFKLIKSGIKAVKELLPKTKIILHLDYGGDNNLYRNWFDQAENHDVNFDIIGLSYYPFWHGTLDELENNLNDISTRYDKEVLILETAYGFTLEEHDDLLPIFNSELAKKAGYPPTIEGQSEFLCDLMDRVSKVKNGKGLGVVYWEPEWIPVKGSTWATQAGQDYINDYAEGGNSWGNQALFDYKGNTLATFNIFKQL